MHHRKCRRSNSGQVLIQGALSLALVFAGGVVAALLVLYAGVGMLFQNKLSLVTSQAAAFAVSIPLDGNADALDQTKTFVQQLMPEVGLTPQNLTVRLQQTTVGTKTGVKVSVSNAFPMVGVAFAPPQVQISDTEFAAPSGCSCD